MKINMIRGTDISDAWFQVVRTVLNDGKWIGIDNGSFAGTKRLQLDCCVINITHPSSRPLEVQLSPACPIPSPIQPGYLDSYIEYLLSGDKKEGEDYTYGQFISVQLPKVIEKFKNGGYGTNQCTIMIGDEASIDLHDPPCLRIIDMKIDNGMLHWYVYFRSWDAWAGFPANIAGLQLVKEYTASELNVKDGEIVAFSKGLHLYDYVTPYIKDYFGGNDD